MPDGDPNGSRGLTWRTNLDRDSVCGGSDVHTGEGRQGPWSRPVNLNHAAADHHATVRTDVGSKVLRDVSSHFVWIDPLIHEEPLFDSADDVAESLAVIHGSKAT